MVRSKVTMTRIGNLQKARHLVFARDTEYGWHLVRFKLPSFVLNLFTGIADRYQLFITTAIYLSPYFVTSRANEAPAYVSESSRALARARLSWASLNADKVETK
jgi:hypothetical protein